uniref:Uncharacterized protein n=1 Tax=Salix viminalis TaxID=40686 RepID=A0A6N2LE50_SALVM
MLVKELFRRCQ